MFLLTETKKYIIMFLLTETREHKLMDTILEISQTIRQLKTDKEICSFLQEILSQSELIDLSKRWRILKMLNEGYTQREIAKTLNVSLCKITRGSQIINDKNAVSTKYLQKG